MRIYTTENPLSSRYCFRSGIAITPKWNTEAARSVEAPASAASLAGLIKLQAQGGDFSGRVIVGVVTGTGLKDTEIALKEAPSFLELPADLAAVEKALGLV